MGYVLLPKVGGDAESKATRGPYTRPKSPSSFFWWASARSHAAWITSWATVLGTGSASLKIQTCGLPPTLESSSPRLTHEMTKAAREAASSTESVGVSQRNFASESAYGPPWPVHTNVDSSPYPSL